MTARHWIVPVFLVLSVILGGATTEGYFSNLILQLLALPLIVWSLVEPQPRQSSAVRGLSILVVILVTIVLIQLIPLPPAIWTSVPGREFIAEGIQLLGEDLPWLPLSLSPNETIASFLWLLPAIAALLCITRLGAYQSTTLAWSLITVTVVSVVVAAVQVAGGRDSSLYFYRVTNFGSGVGFFANSNHQATLLLSNIPFVAALYSARRRSQSLKSASALAIVLTSAALILAVGIYINGSIAGLGLALWISLSSLLLLRYRNSSLPFWAPLATLVALVGAVVLFFATPPGGGSFRADLQGSAGSRQTFVSVTTEAAIAHLPFGSGLGTFSAIYRAAEDPAQIGNTWVNHAHSDVAEIILETGIPGLMLLLTFLLWWGRRAYALWFKDERPDHFARASVLVTAGIIAHSFVEYPLRTAAISTLFAICVALMAQPRFLSKARASGPGEADAVRHLSA